MAGEADDIEEEIETNAETEEDSAEDIFGLSDEEFEKQLSNPPVSENTKDDQIDETAAAAAEEEQEEESTVVVEEEPEKKPAAAETKETKETKETAPAKQTKEKPAAAATTQETDPLKVDDATAAAAYRELFKPFKANGKTVQAQSPEEAIRLMQMGAGHVKYQNQVRPYIARAKTLENAGITDQDLNFLVELHKKSPDAIKKLVRDAGIDPYDITVDEESKAADSKYQPKNYLASEEQISFEETLKDVKSVPEGIELLDSVRTDWDTKSRELVYQDPNILRVLTDQKQSGVYAMITAEMDRRKMLGDLANVPFLDAYHTVGLALDKAGKFGTKEVTAETEKQTTAAVSKVVAKRTAKPKSQAESNDKVKAIAPIKTVAPGKSAPEDASVLDMPDEEFAKLEGLQRFA